VTTGLDTAVTLAEAQADMRHAYLGGATGVAASAVVWLAAAGVAAVVSPRSAVAALFVGGMFIHPAAMLLSKLLGRPGKHQRGNPLAGLAIESTVWLLLAIAIAFLASFHRIEWFFIAMLLTIGGRYFTFASLYGLRIYWACGATLAVAAFALAALNAGAATITLTGGLLELTFAITIFWGHSSFPSKRGQT
jgi:hypothetical protein